MAPEDVMRERFSIFPGAFVIYHKEEPVGFRTYAPVKGHFDNLSNLDNPIIHPTRLGTYFEETFHLLSIGISREHRKRELEKKFKEVKNVPSHQILRAAFEVARDEGTKYITILAETRESQGLYERLNFETIDEKYFDNILCKLMRTKVLGSEKI